MTNSSLRRAAAACLCVLCLSAGFSQEGAAQNQPAQGDQTNITLSTPETAITFDVDAPTVAVPSDAPSGIGLFVRMILVLAVVVALIYGVVFLLRRGMRPVADDDLFLRKVSQVTLSPGKSVQIVTLFNHAYLIGVTDNAINLIGEITDQELVDSMNLYADQNTRITKPRSFADILNIFMPNSARGEAANAFGTSAQDAAEALQRQRERLNGEDQ